MTLTIDECREIVAFALAAEIYVNRKCGMKLTTKDIRFSEKTLTVEFK